MDHGIHTTSLMELVLHKYPVFVICIARPC